MILIFGGAYQGKLDYVLKEYNLTEKDVYHCEMDSMLLNLDKKVIADLEQFIFACTKEEIEAKECLQANRDKLQDKIVICGDISQGIVPMDKVERQWREMTGRCMTYLGQEAEKVVRVFCGIGQEIK